MRTHDKGIGGKKKCSRQANEWAYRKAGSASHVLVTRTSRRKRHTCTATANQATGGSIVGGKPHDRAENGECSAAKAGARRVERRGVLAALFALQLVR